MWADSTLFCQRGKTEATHTVSVSKTDYVPCSSVTFITVFNYTWDTHRHSDWKHSHKGSLSHTVWHQSTCLTHCCTTSSTESEVRLSIHILNAFLLGSSVKFNKWLSPSATKTNWWHYCFHCPCNELQGVTADSACCLPTCICNCGGRCIKKVTVGSDVLIRKQWGQMY